MTDRELMQQALEVLQHCLHYAQTYLQHFDSAYNRHPSAENERGVITDDIEDTFAAIAALRERLAQPEPGTWREVTYDQLMEEVRNRGYEIRDAKITAPQPAQQPLSNGEIYTAYITATNQTLRAQDERLALAFARAIEQAHGIGEKK